MVVRLTLLLAWGAACSGGAAEAVPLPDAPLTARVAVQTPPPFGFWGLNGYVTPAGLADVKARLGAEVFHTSTVSPKYALRTLLPMAREAGMGVTLRMTGDHGRYTTRRGDFDLAAWKRALQPWAEAAPALAPYIADGTLRGHMLLDDIHNFDGTDPTGAELDEMARHSKAILPGLMTFVRERATDMPVPPGGRYQHVDACVNQYKSRHGDVAEFARVEARRAKALDLAFIGGLNIANGGDGSSGQPGWQDGRFAMSAAEIERYGAVLSQIPDTVMFLCWEYDGEERWSDGSVGAAWFDQAPQQAALQALDRRIDALPPAPLMRPAATPGDAAPSPAEATPGAAPGAR